LPLPIRHGVIPKKYFTNVKYYGIINVSGNQNIQVLLEVTAKEAEEIQNPDDQPADAERR
jgi:hypothetical protein